jgi:nucleotide-binding universal stress UspA family protein
MAIDVILVATDFEPPAQAALDFAIELARPLGARVVLAHVYDLPLVGLPDATLMVGPETAARLSDEAQQALDVELARVKDCGVAVRGVLHQGDPREGVGEIAASEKAKLVVVGSHGRRGMARALLGSIAEDVLHRSAVPVTVVHKH